MRLVVLRGGDLHHTITHAAQNSGFRYRESTNGLSSFSDDETQK